MDYSKTYIGVQEKVLLAIEHYSHINIGEKKANCYTASMDEGRKRVLGIMAAILAATKLALCSPDKRVPASICAVSDSVRWADETLKEIDKRWPG